MAGIWSCRRCQRFHVPLDHFHPHPPHGGNDVVVVLAKGRTEEGRPLARDRLDLVTAGVDIRHDLVRAEGVEVGVVVGVTHDLVSRLGEGLDRFRVFVYPLPHDEKSRLDVVAAQYVDEGLGVLVAPGEWQSADGADRCGQPRCDTQFCFSKIRMDFVVLSKRIQLPFWFTRISRMLLGIGRKSLHSISLALTTLCFQPSASI